MWIPADQHPKTNGSGVSDVVDVVTGSGYRTLARLVSHAGDVGWVEYRGSARVANVSYYRYL